SSVGILAWKSALADGIPYDVPDFKDESVRKLYENDHWSPFPSHAFPDAPPPSITGHHEPSATAVARAQAHWEKLGYLGE
ncbi:MAG: hypothetical protein P1S60_16900, partial [Anaerolineae bacterium]|nr:hypothetical protein [Anaerolineae bacterium]